MQVFKQFHKILLDILNHVLSTIYTVKSLEPVLNCTELLFLLIMAPDLLVNPCHLISRIALSNALSNASYQNMPIYNVRLGEYFLLCHTAMIQPRLETEQIYSNLSRL